MTLLTTHTRALHTGDGATVAFAYDFLVLEADHMFVFVDDVQQENSEWSIDGLENPAGGNVTFNTPPADQASIALMRIVPLQQLIDFLSYDPFAPDISEDALDLLTMMVQQNNDESLRSVYLPISNLGDPNTDLPPYKSKEILGWDDGGFVTVPICTCPDPFENQRRRLFGSIDGAGNIIKGKPGFSVVRNSTGNYRVNFASPVTVEYVTVIGLSEDMASRNVALTAEDNNGFNVLIRDMGGAGDPRDANWSFITRWNLSDTQSGIELSVLEYGSIQEDGTVLNGTDGWTTASNNGSSYQIDFNPALPDQEYCPLGNCSDPAERLRLVDIRPDPRNSTRVDFLVYTGGSTPTSGDSPIEFMVIRL